MGSLPQFKYKRFLSIVLSYISKGIRQVSEFVGSHLYVLLISCDVSFGVWF
jgi:hypothetical protein